MDDRKKYDFPGSNAMMIATFVIILALRYFEIIKFSWWIVWPLAIGAAVVTCALVSTIIHTMK